MFFAFTLTPVDIALKYLLISGHPVFPFFFPCTCVRKSQLICRISHSLDFYIASLLCCLTCSIIPHISYKLVVGFIRFRFNLFLTVLFPMCGTFPSGSTKCHIFSCCLVMLSATDDHYLEPLVY